MAQTAAPFSAEVILDSLADGVYVTDPQRKILLWNHRAEEITGYFREEIEGHSCSENILVHEDKDGHKLCEEQHCPLYRAMVTGEASTVPIILYAKSKSGRRLPMYVSVAPIRNAQGEVIAGVEVFRDLREGVQDLERATLIQQHAMKTELPEDPRVEFTIHCTPLEYVGGDFYRIESLTPDRYAILLADVMGHGVAAALYTMQLRSLWEEFRHLLGGPAAFLSSVNDQLSILVQEDNAFATAIYGVLDVARGTFTYAAAGQPGPLLMRKGKVVRELESAGLPLGAAAGHVYELQEEQLGPGDMLFFYSDAAVEEMNAQGRQLGRDGFHALLESLAFSGTAHAMAKLEAALLQYGNGIRVSDDLTLMACRLK